MPRHAAEIVDDILNRAHVAAQLELLDRPDLAGYVPKSRIAARDAERAALVARCIRDGMRAWMETEEARRSADAYLTLTIMLQADDATLVECADKARRVLSDMGVALEACSELHQRAVGEVAGSLRKRSGLPGARDHINYLNTSAEQYWYALK